MTTTDPRAGAVAAAIDRTGPSDDERIGSFVRGLRRSRGLTLVQLAALSDLSQPFLSQLERGQARASMGSLAKIAQALGSSQLELVAGAADLTRPGAGGGPTLVRADEGDRGPYGLGRARLLVQGDRPFYPMTFVADNADPGEFHRHAEDEFVHVLSGRCVVELGGQPPFRLKVGDSLFYPGQVPHRWFAPSGRTYRLFVVKQHVAIGAATALEEAP